MSWVVAFSDDFTGTDGDPWDNNKWGSPQGATGSGTVDIQGNRGRITLNDSAFTGLGVPTLSSFTGDVRVEFTFEMADTTNQIPALTILGSDDTNQTPLAGYSGGLNGSDGNYNIWKEGSGALGSTSFTYATSTTYHGELERHAGGFLRMKVWEDGTTEPDWAILAVDTDRTSGVFNLRALVGSVGQQVTIYWHTVTLYEWQDETYDKPASTVLTETFPGALNDPWPTDTWTADETNGTVDQMGDGRGRLTNTTSWVGPRVDSDDNFGLPFRATFTIEFGSGNSNQWHHVDFVATDASNTYRVGWSPGENYFRLEKYETGSATITEEVGNPFSASNLTWQFEVVALSNGDLRVWAWPDGGTQPNQPVLSFTDTGTLYTSGTLGFKQIGSDSAEPYYVSDLTVYEEAPPDPPTGLTGSAEPNQAVQLNWDAMTGADSYVVQRRPTSEAGGD